MKLRKDSKTCFDCNLFKTVLEILLNYGMSSMSCYHQVVRNEETQILLFDPIFLIKWVRQRNVLDLLLATKQGVSRNWPVLSFVGIATRSMLPCKASKLLLTSEGLLRAESQQTDWRHCPGPLAETVRLPCLPFWQHLADSHNWRQPEELVPYQHCISFEAGSWTLSQSLSFSTTF